MDGSSADRWLARTGLHISAETPDLANSILEYDFPMYLWVEAGPKPTFQLTLSTPGRAASQTTIAAATAAEMERNATGQPQGLDLDHPLRDARVLSKGIGYLRPGPFYNDEAKTPADEWDVSAFKAFIDGAFRTFNRQGVKKLIIDLRGNAGGDSLFSDVMVSWFADRPYQFFSSFKVRASADAIAANQDRLEHDAAAAGPISRRFARLYAGAAPGAVLEFDLPPSLPNPTERFAGEVFVLIDRQTYSNAIAVAATIQDNRFGLVMGEPTTDMATAYGAMEHFTLPVTGAVIGFPKARIVRPSGDLRSRGVTPDIPIAVPVIQTADDEVLKRAREIVLHRR
jgi:C-terminal processing protease CtpA/Prc